MHASQPHSPLQISGHSCEQVQAHSKFVASRYTPFGGNRSSPASVGVFRCLLINRLVSVSMEAIRHHYVARTQNFADLFVKLQCYLHGATLFPGHVSVRRNGERCSHSSSLLQAAAWPHGYVLRSSNTARVTSQCRRILQSLCDEGDPRSVV